MTRRRVRFGDAEVSVEAEDARPLVEVLRAQLGVRSASKACRDGSCGACRVLLDGVLVASCEVRWGDVAEGARIETYETLDGNAAAIRAVDAFSAERPTRCRLCVGALGVTAVSIARGARPKGEAIDAALERATCMCTGRGSWRRALQVD